MASDAKESLANRLVEERPDLQSILTRLMADAPGDLFLRLGEQDGAARLAEELAATFAPGDVIALYTGPQVTWEQFGAVYSHLGRHHEAMALFLRLYDHLLSHQTIAATQVHKGVPLYWVALCHAALGNTVLAKRYLMLTLCEDAIKDKGTIDFRDSGTYFRLVWLFGLPDADLRRYVRGCQKTGC